MVYLEQIITKQFTTTNIVFFGCGKIILREQPTRRSIERYVVEKYETTTATKRLNIDTASRKIHMNTLQQVGCSN